MIPRLVMTPEFRSHLSGPDPFDAVMALDGEPIRALEGRRTIRLKLGDIWYFAKIHHGIGWWEIVKNLIRFRLPVLGAENEWLAIQRARSLGIDTPSVVAFGCRGSNPARLESFIVTEELTNTVSLESLVLQWREHPPHPRIKWLLIMMVARIAYQMHANGMNHRDFYLCHFRLDPAWTREIPPTREPVVYLMDLHRAQMRFRTPTRWQVKDLAGLFFSTMELGLTARDYLRFLHYYRRAELRWVLVIEALYWKKVRRRAIRQFRSFHKREPVLHRSLVG